VIIALASPRVATSLEHGLETMDRLIAGASARGAELVCFPEAYLPGLRGQDFAVLPWDALIQSRALDAIGTIARSRRTAVIAGLERVTEGGRQVAAFVVNADGSVQGFQTKNQLDPTEDQHYVPGDARRIFEVNSVRFGISICHEGWRYPETVRWAAARGARIVFHPQLTGTETGNIRLTEWGASGNPYYEKAMMMRSIENGIWFASVNYAVRSQEAATSIIDPSGKCAAFLPYGEEGVLVSDVDVDAATGALANRFAPDRYREAEA
jgi:predicted amidohydrolase